MAENRSDENIKIKISSTETLTADQIRKKIIWFRQEQTRLNGMYQTAVKENTRLRSEISDLKKSLPDKDDIMSARIQLNDGQPATVAAVISELAKVREEKAMLAVENKKLKNDTAKLKADAEKLSAEKKNMAADNVKLNKEKSKLTADLEAQKKYYKENYFKTDKKFPLNDKEAFTAAQLVKKIQWYRTEHDTLKTEYAKLKDEKAVLEAKCKDTQYHLDEIQKSKTYKIGLAITCLPRKMKSK